MLGDIFQKIFQFLIILYSLYNNLAIFRVKKFHPIKIGQNKASKNVNWRIHFWKKTWKNSPWDKFRP